MPKRSRNRMTKRNVDSLRIRAKDYIAWDRDLPGFGVRVLTTGRKVFVVQARGPTGSRRLSIGPVGECTVADARKKAAVHINRIKRGDDLAREEADPGVTVAEMADRFMRLHIQVSCASSTVKLYQGVMDTHIVPELGERNLETIRRSDLVKLHQRLQGTPRRANHTIEIFAQMFSKAEEWGLVRGGRNPGRGIRKYRAQARERFLTRDEYRRLGEVLNQGEEDGSLDETAVAALRVLILTGCRRNEVLTLRWDDVDVAARELRLRDSKTGPRMVALTSPVEAVLNDVVRTPGNPWVFVGKGREGRRTTLQWVWNEITKRAGLHGLRLHDLRHSYASRALALGESLTMIGKLLNHVEIRTTARYAHLMQDAEKDAAARVGDMIARRVGTNTLRSGVVEESRETSDGLAQ